MIDMKRMKLGDRIDLPVYPKVNEAVLSLGEVVYIHPKKRFFTLEFTTDRGRKIRESYIPRGPIACRDEKRK